MKKRTGLFGKNGLAELLRPYRGRVICLCILTVVLSLLQVAMALLSRFVIDAALTDSGRLAFWGAALVADMLAIVGLHALLSWVSGSTTDTMTAKLRKDILRVAAFSRRPEILDHHSGELLSRGMEDVHTVCDGAVSVIPTFVGQVTRLVAAFAAVLMISPVVAGVLFAAAVIVGVATACLRPAIKARHRRVRETDEQVMAVMQEDLQQLELIQSLGVQEPVLKRFQSSLRENLKARFKRRLWSVGTNGVINAVSQVGAGILLLWGASYIAAGTLSYGSLTAMLQLLGLFRSPVLGLSGLFSRFATIEVSAERLGDLRKPCEPGPKIENQPKVSAVVFEKVTFSYPGDELPVLQDFDFRFPLEGWTCLTGISGKGKTTIFKLILGLYTPQSGRIYLQTEQGELPCTEATRQLFAYVPQDYALFSGTILENLQLVAPEADETRLRQALSVAQADFVWELTEQLQAQVRENNAGLSKGQLQRLAIARAVLMERPVFLLDECTSALDAQTEDAVLQGLKALGKCAILVTHRPEAVKALDAVTFISMEQ